MTSSERYLCFNLSEEEFAIPLLSVKEVIGYPPITPIPQAPTYFLGIMNLRGAVISIMDLRQKLGFKSPKNDETTVVILDLGEYFLGCVVDSVNSVISIEESKISDKPTMDNPSKYEHIKGVFQKESQFVILLDVAKALSVEDRSSLKANQSLKAS